MVQSLGLAQFQMGGRLEWIGFRDHVVMMINKQTNTITLLFNKYITQCAMHTLQIMFNGVKDIKHNSGVDGI